MVTRLSEESNNVNIALALVLLLYAFYTALQIFNLGFQETETFQHLMAVFWLVPGILGVIILLNFGFTTSECYLQYSELSLKGALLLSITLIILPFILLSGKWIGFDPVEALIYAPASAIAQELFFRSVLLPVLLKKFKNKSVSIGLHSLLFGIWHVGVFLIAPLGAALMVVAVPTLLSILWALQVFRDKSVFYLMILHSIFLVSMSMFLW